MNNIELIDVIIIGAGFAGLSAAKYFSSKSIKCLVIEGRSRVGGRTLSQAINDEQWTIDLGGQWIGPTQKRILSFVEEFHCQLIEQTWYHTNPECVGQAIGLKPLTNEQLEQIEIINSQWDQMALQLPSVEHALNYELSSKWSLISCAQFIEEHPLAKDLLVQQELKLEILAFTGMSSFLHSKIFRFILFFS